MEQALLLLIVMVVMALLWLWHKLTIAKKQLKKFEAEAKIMLSKIATFEKTMTIETERATSRDMCLKQSENALKLEKKKTILLKEQHQDILNALTKQADISRLEPYLGKEDTRWPLSVIKINASECVLIMCRLRNTSTVTELILNGNKINDIGAIAISENLRIKTTLKQLNVASNEITAIGTLAICRALEENTTLGNLRMDANPLRTNGIEHIIKLVQMNTTINSLTLQETQGSKDVNNVLKTKWNATGKRKSDRLAVST